MNCIYLAQKSRSKVYFHNHVLPPDLKIARAQKIIQKCNVVALVAKMKGI